MAILEHYGAWDPLWVGLKTFFVKAKDIRCGGGGVAEDSCCTPYIHVASLLPDMPVTDSLLLLAKLDKLLVAGM